MDFKNILIFRIGHLGDMLVSLPAFWAVRKSFPESKITLLSNGNSEKQNYVLAQSVLPATGLFDDWISYPTDGGKYFLVKNSAKMLLEIRKRKFDAVIYLMTRNRTPAQIKRDKTFFNLAGIKKIIGLEYFEKNLLDFSMPRPFKPTISEGEFFLKCLEAENFPLPPRENLKPDLLLSSEEVNFAENWLKKKCRNLENLVGVAPSSKWESKIWAEDRFEFVVGKLIEQKNIFPIIFGGPEDRKIGERLLEKWKTGANAAGELNVRQAASALSKCRLFIGNDTGTMHLAASVGTTCIGIFAAIDWLGRWHPFGNQHKIFREFVECEGCFLPVCPRNNECLDKISAESVLSAALKKLD